MPLDPYKVWKEGVTGARRIRARHTEMTSLGMTPSSLLVQWDHWSQDYLPCEDTSRTEGSNPLGAASPR